MKANSLKSLNDAKTEFLVLGTQQQLNKVTDINIRSGDDKLNQLISSGTLGLILIAN